VVDRPNLELISYVAANHRVVLKNLHAQPTHHRVVLKNLRSDALLYQTHYHRRFIQDPRGGDTLVDPE
jgi:hypothetical protein